MRQPKLKGFRLSWQETFWSALRTAGIPEVPEQFSVVPFPQKIPQSMLGDIATFIDTFERITGRRAWQEKVTAQSPKIALPNTDVHLWTDLRVWAYRGEIFLLSGRASCDPERLDLTLPGGWLPTLIQVKENG